MSRRNYLLQLWQNVAIAWLKGGRQVVIWLVLPQYIFILALKKWQGLSLSGSYWIRLRYFSFREKMSYVELCRFVNLWFISFMFWLCRLVICFFFSFILFDVNVFWNYVLENLLELLLVNRLLFWLLCRLFIFLFVVPILDRLMGKRNTENLNSLKLLGNFIIDRFCNLHWGLWLNRRDPLEEFSFWFLLFWRLLLNNNISICEVYFIFYLARNLDRLWHISVAAQILTNFDF